MEKLQVRIILEILGRPIENVSDALDLLISKLSSEKEIKVLEKQVHQPVPVKDSKDLFTAFADVTLEINKIDSLFYIIFNYMPSNIELIYPEEIKFRNEEINLLTNQLVQRLHTYDAITKKMLYEKDILLKKLKEHAPHVFKKTEDKKEDSEKTESKKEKKNKS